ncbi:MAG: hypothetical protein JSS43_00910 [Proteobacteria bacterium]|nr:hypothetical protein [Pseudomonadota bacterium]
MQITISLLATFAAIVLGLLTASVKQNYDKAAHDWGAYGFELAALDRCLSNYGPQADAARTALHRYVAAAIATNWPAEPNPAGLNYPDTSGMARIDATPVLTGLMEAIGNAILSLTPSPGPQAERAATCRSRFGVVRDTRLGLLGDEERGLFNPFYQILLLWLMIIFACFGLVAPPNGVAVLTVVLCAFSLSSVIFLILDLGQPFGGLFGISSTSMRAVLATMLTPAQ